MAEVIGWIEKLQGLGIGGLSLFFLYITNKWWVGQAKEREAKHEIEKKQIREDFQTVIDAKDSVIGDLSGQLRDAMQGSRADMERQYERQMEAVQRSEQVIADNTTAVNNLGDLIRQRPLGGAT